MIPVILSGGGGTRLWPVSRQSFPKQFCDLLDESLFNKTAKRLAPLGQPWVITTREMQTLTERSLKELGLPTENTIYEPFGKNTAAAVALVCHRMAQLGKSNEVVGIFPADHLIDDDEKFLALVFAGEKLAMEGHIVTLGVRPTHAASGYGYIETAQSSVDVAASSRLAIAFREKPSEQVALEYLSRGNFFWNAGMFIFRVDTMTRAFETYAPEIWSTIAKLKADLSNLDTVYEQVKSTSIDYAIMERLPHHQCIPCEFGWTDLGSWDAVAEILGQASERFVPQAAVRSSGNFVYPFQNKTYGLVGVEDLIVVDTADALLIVKRGESEQVKQVFDRLNTAKP